VICKPAYNFSFLGENKLLKPLFNNFFQSIFFPEKPGDFRSSSGDHQK